jgi:hypothetical protein
MLAAGPGVAYISEPLNVLHRPGVFGAAVKHWYTYICPDNEAEYLPAFRQLIDYDYHLLNEIRSVHSGRDLLRMVRDFGIFYVGSLHGQRPLIKDPFAVFSTRWFARSLGSNIVVTVRHPAAFASSLKRLKWSFDFADLVQQPLLVRDVLEPYRDALQRIESGDIVGQAALLWTIIYQAVHRAHEQDPAIHIALHETLSLEPLVEFRKLYGAVGLSFTPSVERAILGSSSSKNPQELPQGQVHSVQLDSRSNLENWRRRLSTDEIGRIRRMTEAVCQFYYPEASWN